MSFPGLITVPSATWNRGTVCPLPHQRLVFSQPDRSPLLPNTVTHAFGKLAKRAGFDGIHFLRHAHASIILQQAVRSTTVAERLGHSTVAITLDTYSHVTPRVNENAANKFEEALRQAESTAEETIGQPNFTQLHSEQKKRGPNGPLPTLKNWQEREDSNPRPLVLESNGICLTP